MKIKRFFKWRFKTIFLITFIIVIVYLAIAIYLNFKNSIYNPITTFSAPLDYVNLFNNDARKKLVLKVNYVIKGRNPIALFDYEKKYSVLVYKLDASKDISLKNLVKQDIHDNGGIGSGFTTLKTENLQISYTWDSIPLIDEAIITFYGKYLATSFKNDKIISTSAYLKKFYLKYGKKKSLDIFIEKRESNSIDLPTEIMTIKNGRSLYFVFAFGKEENTKIGPSLVLDLVNIDQ